MTIAYPRLRAVFSGTLTGSQRWSIGASLAAPDDAPSQSSFDAWSALVLADLETVWAGAGTFRAMNSSDTDMDTFTVYYLPAGTDKASVLTERAITDQVGVSTNPELPTQSCLVISTKSTIPGRSGRGRMYMPATAIVLSEYQASSAICTALANEWATVLTQLGAESLGGVSTIPIIAGMAPRNTPIVSASVDSRLDIQRRRADKVPALHKAMHAV